MNFFPGKTSAACYIYPKFSVLELGRIYVFASWKGATIGILMHWFEQAI